jgi:hypothetical protein
MMMTFKCWKIMLVHCELNVNADRGIVRLMEEDVLESIENFRQSAYKSHHLIIKKD